ncbi:hypothetical protein Pmani_039544 [Petrolisthes manimaculis]|uniref:G-protein coupled receptors family 1 profile domain-containing protein n=1 Tax=Petrolisthes manimaculis TaxID=1843537 RepID=A0AAE1NCI3_9EUCA|nr:hypothetical protein Pmani_039544 [Petrolisthes manimaculis]
MSALSRHHHLKYFPLCSKVCGGNEFTNTDVGEFMRRRLESDLCRGDVTSPQHPSSPLEGRGSTTDNLIPDKSHIQGSVGGSVLDDGSNPTIASPPQDVVVPQRHYEYTYPHYYYHDVVVGREATDEGGDGGVGGGFGGIDYQHQQHQGYRGGYHDYDYGGGDNDLHDPFVYPYGGADEDGDDDYYYDDDGECVNGVCPPHLRPPLHRPDFSYPDLHLDPMEGGGFVGGAVGGGGGGGGFGDVVVETDEGHHHPEGEVVRGEFLPAEVNISQSQVRTICLGKLSKNYRDVVCLPKPDAFNPCEDIMGNVGLRVAVWVVVVTAVFGPGCQVAGFLTVFASELSILTLAVITLERWYANHLRHPPQQETEVICSYEGDGIGLGICTHHGCPPSHWCLWLFQNKVDKKDECITYSNPISGLSLPPHSICLPMETADGGDRAYLLILLTTNGLAFLLICVCYAKMYCSIAGNHLAANTSDTTVAKRMALLVFTDFACWAPIAFFGLTAVSGYPFISVTHSKFLLVFFYPLNSCANPYLYAILTRQYRRDLFIMLARHGFFTKRAMKYKGALSSTWPPNHHNVCVSGTGGGTSGGPSRRISTLTQITTCGDWKSCRARDGSQESLGRPLSPSSRCRNVSAELTVPGLPERRLLPVSEFGVGGHYSDPGPRVSPGPHTNYGALNISPGGESNLAIITPTRSRTNSSPEPNVRGRSSSPATIITTSSPKPPSSLTTTTSGSPHPIKNCYARMSFTPEQEALLLRYSHGQQPSATMPTRRRCGTPEADEDGVPMSTYTPGTPDTLTTPISPELDQSV